MDSIALYNRYPSRLTCRLYHANWGKGINRTKGRGGRERGDGSSYSIGTRERSVGIDWIAAKRDSAARTAGGPRNCDRGAEKKERENARKFGRDLSSGLLGESRRAYCHFTRHADKLSAMIAGEKDKHPQ